MLAKAQVLSFDFMVAIGVFLLVSGILYAYWNYASLQIEETRTINDMVNKLYLVSNVWFRDGRPVYWNPSDVIELGLQNDHRLNTTKMNALNDLGYQRVLNMLGTENYNIHYRVYDENNYTLFEFGINPSNYKNLMKTKRIGILNGTGVIIESILWC
jgi:hypothetical protein